MPFGGHNSQRDTRVHLPYVIRKSNDHDAIRTSRNRVNTRRVSFRAIQTLTSLVIIFYQKKKTAADPFVVACKRFLCKHAVFAAKSVKI